ncbi:hypothetical protein HDU76_011565, partial [Blyttiomyces sp. JEL0837]
SQVLPVDHPTKKGSYHLGPQVRDFYAVTLESVGTTIGICQMDPTEREKLLSPQNIARTRSIMLEFYNKYKTWGYPLFNPLPALAAASPGLYKNLSGLREFFDKKPNERSRDAGGSGSGGNSGNNNESGKVFCSEMVAMLYRDLGVRGFNEHVKPNEFTPLELEVMDVFGGRVVYARVGESLMLTSSDGRIVAGLS